MKKLIIMSLVLFIPVLTFAASPTTPNTSDCRIWQVSLPPLPADTSPAVTLQRQGYRSESRRWLRLAEERKAYKDVTPEICYALDYVKLGSFPLTSFGTSMSKLAALQIVGYRSEALVWIRLYRERRPNGTDWHELSYAKELAQRAGENFDELMKLPTSALPRLPQASPPQRPDHSHGFQFQFPIS